MNKDVYFVNYYHDILSNSKNNTIFEFNNVIVTLPNKLRRNIYNRINHNLRYFSINGDLHIYHEDDKFKYIRLFMDDNTTIEKYTIFNNLEIKDDYLLSYCGNITLKIDNDIYDSDTFNYIMIYRNLSVGKNAYVITLPKNKNDYPFERVSITIDATNESVIDFSDIKWLVKNSTYMDSDFMDIYNKLILERI